MMRVGNSDWEGIVKTVMYDVRQKYKMLDGSVQFGAYYEPDHYFVSYIFKTERELAQAKESGLTEEIIRYHLEQLRLYGYPEKGLKKCTFASQEECDREYDGNWYYYYK